MLKPPSAQPGPIHDAVALKVMRLSEHERCKTVYVVQSIADGKDNFLPAIRLLARIYIVRPPKGHGEGILKVGVQAWTYGDALLEDGTMIPHYGEARGGGYDKLEAALQHAYVGGYTLGRGLGALLPLQRRADFAGWTILGDVG